MFNIGHNYTFRWHFFVSLDQVYLRFSDLKVVAMHKSHAYQSNAVDNSPERPPSEHVHRGPQPLKSTAGQNQQDLTAGEAR